MINLEESIAITQNYVSESNLFDVLTFLRTKPDQISGVRDRQDEAVAAESMYDEFVKALEEHQPDLLERALAEGKKKRNSGMKRALFPLPGVSSFSKGGNAQVSNGNNGFTASHVSSKSVTDGVHASHSSFSFNFDVAHSTPAVILQ